MAALWENNVGTDVIVIYFKRWRKIMSLYLAAEHYNVVCQRVNHSCMNYGVVFFFLE